MSESHLGFYYYFTAEAVRGTFATYFILPQFLSICL